MTKPFNVRRLAAAGMAALLSLALAACLVLPGKFAETLDLRKDGRFTYTYKGEIVVLGLTKLMGLADAMDDNVKFEPRPCFDDETGDMRDCTKDEIARQKEAWDADRKEQAEARKKRNAETQAMLGGIDPNDPRAGEELAERLRKQAGWKKVVYKGDGIYEVEFAITGRLDHDFTFPTMERMAGIIPFLTINVRADGSVRVNSPLFENQGNNGGQAAAVAGIGGMMGSKEDNDFDGLPPIDGTFTLTTDGEILANNTEDGPVADPAGKRLEWKINPRTPAAPMALVQLGR